MKYIIGLFISVLLVSCSTPSSSPQEQVVTLVNKSETSIFYGTIGLQTSYLIDLAPMIPFESNKLPELKTSEKLHLQKLSEYEKEDGIAIYVYKSGYNEGSKVIKLTNIIQKPFNELTQDSQIILN
jgi:hypothetical protein